MYQQFVMPGEPAGRVTTAYVLLGAALALLGAVAYRNPELLWVSVAASAATFLIVWALASKAQHHGQNDLQRDSAFQRHNSRA
jgi:sulfite exporter TauE/SafE